MMKPKTVLVVTSIASPNEALKELASGCRQHGMEFFLIGDEKSPRGFELEGCRFYGLREQMDLGFAFARECPTGNYARKNIGYLLAMRAAAAVIMETDDDNFPRPEFWKQRQEKLLVPLISSGGWVNTYRYFTDAKIWPRGLALESINDPVSEYGTLAIEEVDCPIQQGLTDEDPDVDAIYRLSFPLPQYFRTDRVIALGSDCWSPFNSQNTTWWREAFPLLYLPAYCSMRMTDIWRSFVAQRIAWTNNWNVLFHGPTVRHDRNHHDLLRDFQDEVPGYLNNGKICAALENLTLQPGLDNIVDNMRVCYSEFVRMKLIAEAEMDLLETWISDIHRINQTLNSEQTMSCRTD
jgi:hypothetical protein